MSAITSDKRRGLKIRTIAAGKTFIKGKSAKDILLVEDAKLSSHRKDNSLKMRGA